MDDIKIKVTDRRLFTESGELREEYSSDRTAESNVESSAETNDEKRVEPKPDSSPGAAHTPPSEGRSAEPTRRDEAPRPGPSRSQASDSGVQVSSTTTDSSRGGSRPDPALGPAEHGEPGFVDLVASLAEPIALFLGDARLPGGESAEDLGRARYYIDLLKILRDKTSGNLVRDEEEVLGELLYRLQMRYVQKTR